MPNVESLENPPTPDLLETLGDRVITVFGMTGTITDLAHKCPVDLTDPRITLEDKNEFVIKAANEAGLEIEAQHEEMFAEVLQKHGLEKKFSVAVIEEKSSTEDTVIQSKTPKDQTDISSTHPEVKSEPSQELPKLREATVEAVTTPVKINTETAQPAEQTYPENTPITLVNEVHAFSAEQQMLAEHVVREAEVHLVIDETTVVLPIIQESEVPEATAEAAIEFEKLPYDKAETEVAVDIEAIFATSEVDGIAEVDTAFEQLETTETDYAGEPLPDILQEPEMAEAETPIAAWATELAKEPAVLYGDFVTMLQVFAEQPMAPAADTETDNQPLSVAYDFDTAAATDEKVQPAPPIIAAVAERLAELEPDDKEIAEPILRNIAGAVHGLHILKSGEEADAQTIADVEAQLETMCAALFEAIGMKNYCHQDIAAFIEVVLRPDFPKVDLATAGMHNAKRVPPMADDTDNVADNRQHILGQVALLFHLQAELNSVAA